MKDLNKLREEIDQVDTRLLDLLSERVKLVQEVGEYKKTNDLPIVDPEREQKIIDQKIEKAAHLNLRPEFIQKIWRTIFDEAYVLEEKV